MKNLAVSEKQHRAIKSVAAREGKTIQEKTKEIITFYYSEKWGKAGAK